VPYFFLLFSPFLKVKHSKQNTGSRYRCRFLFRSTLKNRSDFQF
jgi:hypothetical protein